MDGRKTVGVPRGIGETTVKIAFLEIKNGLFAVWYIFGEEVVEIVRLQRKENTTTISYTGCEDEIEEEPSETPFSLGCRWRD